MNKQVIKQKISSQLPFLKKKYKVKRLENFLTETLHQKVDLVTKKAIKPVVKDDILRKTIYV